MLCARPARPHRWFLVTPVTTKMCAGLPGLVSRAISRTAWPRHISVGGANLFSPINAAGCMRASQSAAFETPRRTADRLGARARRRHDNRSDAGICLEENLGTDVAAGGFHQALAVAPRRSTGLRALHAPVLVFADIHGRRWWRWRWWRWRHGVWSGLSTLVLLLFLAPLTLSFAEHDATAGERNRPGHQ